MRAHCGTHQGWVRENNEDHCLVKRFDNGALLAAVADGLGGHAAGERASQMVIESLSEFNVHARDVAAHFLELIRTSNKRIMESSARDPSLRGMATTLTAAYLSGGAVHWAHVGDTRLSLFRGDELIPVTDDHTMSGLLLQKGEIGREAARVHPYRNRLLRCVGCEHFDADTGAFTLMHGDLLMLSSDGLHDMLSEATITELLMNGKDPAERTDRLIQAALSAGGHDNITVVIIEV